MFYLVVMKEDLITFGNFHSPVGTIFLASLRGCLTDVGIGESEQAFLERIAAKFGPDMEKDNGAFGKAFGELERYFSGKPVEFDLRLRLVGTPFELFVWKAMQEIPWGEARTYGWIAARIGNPKAVRAVGGACGKNPVPLIIPCHRVLRSNGEIGGYSGGLGIKRALLKTEGISYRSERE